MTAATTGDLLASGPDNRMLPRATACSRDRSRETHRHRGSPVTLSARQILRSWFVAVPLLFVGASAGRLATWAPSLQPAAPRPPADSVDRVATIVNRTLRQIAHVSIGGARVRVRLSNEYGDRPLVIRSARIALRTNGVVLTIPSLADVAVSRAIADSARTSTRHSLRLQTNYFLRSATSPRRPSSNQRARSATRAFSPASMSSTRTRPA